MESQTLSRRTVLGAAAIGTVLAPLARPAAATSRIQAIAFDGFPIFDPRSVTAAAQRLFPEQGEKLAAIWSQKLFDYTWIETAAGQYSNFEMLAQQALLFASDSLHLDISEAQSVELVGSYSRLDVWPDVKPALARLRGAGLRLVLLSNMTEAMLRSNMKRSGIEDFFEPPLSTDRVRRYKPSPTAYQMAVDALALPKDAIGFAAFGGWDAVGAAWFGYRTAWVNRFLLPNEMLGPKPAVTAPGLEAVRQLASLD
jgi:2-haloacid dehalogenase